MATFNPLAYLICVVGGHVWQLTFANTWRCSRCGKFTMTLRSDVDPDGRRPQ